MHLERLQSGVGCFFGFLSVIRSFYFSRTNLYRATEGVKTLWRQKWASPDKKDFIVLWMLEGQKPSDVNYSDVMSIERMLKLKNRKKWRGHVSPSPPPWRSLCPELLHQLLSDGTCIVCEVPKDNTVEPCRGYHSEPLLQASNQSFCMGMPHFLKTCSSAMPDSAAARKYPATM